MTVREGVTVRQQDTHLLSIGSSEMYHIVNGLHVVTSNQLSWEAQ